MQKIPDWSPQPQAEHLLQNVLKTSLEGCEAARKFRSRLLDEASVRLRDIIDHVGFSTLVTEDELDEAGWEKGADNVWRNPGGLFPDFVAADRDFVACRVESVEHFVDVFGITAAVDGDQFVPYRKVKAFIGSHADFHAVERGGYAGYTIPDVNPADIRKSRLHLQRFLSRRREFDTPAAGLKHTEDLVLNAVSDLGPGWTCALFFKAERDYWLNNCRAGRIQKARQDAAGIGWANIDHDTYDSSRQWFHHTIRILEHMGYECRELFYAGHQAGWGSQVLEHPVLGTTIFADIDLAPEELDIDFAHMELEPLPKYRRAGIWCAMHGESMLEAGLNHVAGLYDQKHFRQFFKNAGINLMSPFSDMPYLYQELTSGEWRAVDPARVDWLEENGHISSEEAENFRLNGAVATHLENIERNDGYKGFNQQGIDNVLRIIDPRKNSISQKMA